VAVLTYGFWQKHFGGDQNVVGKTFALDGVAITVVGVMPEGFDFFVKENSNIKKNRSSGCRLPSLRTRACAAADL